MRSRPDPWRQALAMIVLPAAACLAGCEDVDWDWEMRWRKKTPDRRVRPAARDAGPATPRAASMTPTSGRAPDPGMAGEQTTATGPPSAPPSVWEPEPVAKPPSPPAAAGVFQLFLVSEGEVSAGSDQAAHIRLSNCAARPAALVLSRLILPMGLGGSEHQHYLVYQTPAEWRAAQDLVDEIDVPAAGDAAGGAFPAAIRCSLDVLGAGLTPPRDRTGPCLLSLRTCSGQSVLSTRRRWMAAMLAGRLASDEFQFEEAAKDFAAAAELVTAGSLEQLSALWRQAECLDQAGDRAASEAISRRIVEAFAAHSRTSAYQRAQNASAGR